MTCHGHLRVPPSAVWRLCLDTRVACAGVSSAFPLKMVCGCSVEAAQVCRGGGGAGACHGGGVRRTRQMTAISQLVARQKNRVSNVQEGKETRRQSSLEGRALSKATELSRRWPALSTSSLEGGQLGSHPWRMDAWICRPCLRVAWWGKGEKAVPSQPVEQRAAPWSGIKTNLRRCFYTVPADRPPPCMCFPCAGASRAHSRPPRSRALAQAGDMGRLCDVFGMGSVWRGRTRGRCPATANEGDALQVFA